MRVRYVEGVAIHSGPESCAVIRKGGSTISNYVYNALGQLIKKTVGSITTFLVYDEAGHLLGEYTSTGALIEKVSGMSYYDYVESHVFKPSGMNNTASLPESVRVPNRAAGYMKENGAWVSNVNTLPYRGMAAGGGYATAGDLLRFGEALESGKLLSKNLLAEATTRFFKEEPYGYGYGFMISGHGSLANYGHDGGAPGMNAEFRLYPKLGYVLIGLSNLDPPAAGRLIGYFSNRMPNTL